MSSIKHSVLSFVVMLIGTGMMAGLFVSPAMAQQAQIGADAFKQGDYTETVPVQYDANGGTGSMPDSKIVTAVIEVDEETGESKESLDVPETQLPKNRFKRQGFEFNGWKPVNDEIIIPNEATLIGLSFITDTNNDGKNETFDLSNSVVDDKLQLHATWKAVSSDNKDDSKNTDSKDGAKANGSNTDDVVNEPVVSKEPVRGSRLIGESVPSMRDTPRTLNEEPNPLYAARPQSLSSTPSSFYTEVSQSNNTAPRPPSYDRDNDTKDEHGNATLDGSTIEKIEVSWITHNAGREQLVLNPTGTGAFSVKLRIDLSTSGQYAYAPGDIQVRFPKNIFTNRYNNWEGMIDLPVPASPDKGATFNYQIIGNEVVLTNAKRIAAASNNYFEVSFEDLNPVSIISGAVHGDFTAQVSINTHDGNTLTKTSNSLTAVVNTNEVVTNAFKRGDVYEYIPTSWKNYITPPRGFVSNDYVYVDWYTYAYIQGNQPFTTGINDPVLEGKNAVNGAVLLGGTLTSQAGNTVYSHDNIFNGWSSNGNKFYHHLYVAYPKSYFGENGAYVTNDVTYTLTTKDTNHVTEASASARLFWKPYKYSQPTGHFMVHKWGYDENGSYKGANGSIYEGHRGKWNYGLNELHDDGSTMIGYTILAKNMPYPWTCDTSMSVNPENCGKVNVDFEVTDKDVYWFGDYENPLTSEDFEFTGLEIGSTTMYKFGRLTHAGLGYDGDDFSKVVYAEAGSWGYNPDSTVARPDYTVSVKTDNGAWVIIANVTWDGLTPRITMSNGTLVDGTFITFPENVTDWKVNYSTHEAGHYLYFHPQVTLKGTVKAKEFVRDLMDNSDAPSSIVRNEVVQDVTQNGNEVVTIPAYGEDSVNGVTQASWMRKTGTQTGTDKSKQQVTVQYTLNVYNQSNLTVRSKFDTARAKGYVEDDPQGVYWDLLPAHVTLDESTIKVDSNSKITYVRTHANWRGSGRTMLEVGVTHTTIPTYLTSSNGGRGDGYGDTRWLTFRVHYKWVDMLDYGKALLNSASYMSRNDHLGTINGLKGEPDDPRYGNNTYSRNLPDNDVGYFTNLDDTRDDPSSLYGGHSLTVNANIAATNDLQKYVAPLQTEEWDDGLGDNKIIIPTGGQYRYRLRMASDSTAKTKDIILYDDIEAFIPTHDHDDYGAEKWYGSFKSVDVTQLVSMGIKPVVYYSTQPIDMTQYKWGEDYDTEAKQETPDLTDTAVWSTTLPSDPSTVRAIAIDCREAQDGTEFVLQPLQSINAYITMTAPMGDVASDAIHRNAHAFNNVYMSSTQVLPSGQEAKHYVHQDYTKVGLKSFYIKVSKAWDDNNDQDGKRTDTVRVQLMRDGAPYGEPIILSNENDWSHDYGILDYMDAQDGHVFNYDVMEDTPEGYELGVTSTTTETEDAYLMSFNLTNTHVPETINLHGAKLWVNDTIDTRAEQVTIQLLKDGAPYSTRVVSEATNWEWDAIGLPKYRDHGTLINWSVREAGYTQGYKTRVNGLDVINEYDPFTDLILTKRVVNGVDGASNDKTFTFTLSIMKDGKELTEDYDWVSSTGRSGKISHGGEVTIRKDESITVQRVPSEAKYEWSESKAEGFTSTGENLTGITKAGIPVNTIVTNTYTANGTAAISARKELTDKLLKQNEFKFELVELNDTLEPGDVLRTAVNDKNGDINFGALFYYHGTTPSNSNGTTGTYHYGIREVNTNKDYIEYDNHLSIVQVDVTDNGDGTLSTVVSYPDNNNTFTNHYHSSGAVQLTANKGLTGDELTEGRFTFGLYELNGDEESLITEASNNADGQVVFPQVDYTQADIDLRNDEKNWREYMIRETQKTDPDIVYDEHDEKIRVRLIDNGRGHIIAETYLQDEQSLAWVNRVAPGDLIISKEVTNGDEEAEFDFVIDIVPPKDSSLPKDVELEYAKLGTEPMGLMNVTNDSNTHSTSNYNRNVGQDLDSKSAAHDEDNDEASSNSTVVSMGSERQDDNGMRPVQPQFKAMGNGTLKGQVYAASTSTTGTWGTCPWELKDGVLTISAGAGASQSSDDSPWYQWRSTITNIVIEDGVIFPVNCQSLFAALIKVTSFTGTPDTSNVTSMSNMFRSCSNLSSFDLSGWDTSNVTSMDSMFANCSKLTSLDLSSFDTSKVTNMDSMFKYCPSLSSLDLSGWDTSNVTNMSWMFYYCNFSSLDLSGFDTSNVTTMDSMFYKCSSLSSLELSGWDTSNVTSMSSMFSNCTKLSSLDLSSFNTSNVKYMSYMFDSCSSLSSLDLSSFNTNSNVTSMSYMFYKCSRLSSLDLSSFNTSNVTNMSYMFAYCSSLSSIDLSSFNTSNVTNMDDMFAYCSKLTRLDLSGFDTSNVTSMGSMFSDCSSLSSLDLSGWDTSNVTGMWHMFYGCSSLSSLDLSGFDTSKVTSMSAMFSNSGILSLDLSGFDTSKVKDMSFMFDKCSSLSSLDLSGWVTSKVKDMGYMFYNCSSLSSLDLSSFNTSNVTSMYYMFAYCSSLLSLDLSSFNTSYVTHMGSMFSDCSSLSSLDLSSFNTSKVASMSTSTSSMFRNCSKLTRVNIGAKWFNNSKFKTNTDTFPQGNTITWVPMDNPTVTPVTWGELASSWNATKAGWYKVFMQTITFNANGGNGQQAPFEFAPTTEFTLPVNKFYRYPHKFTGWNTKPDGTGDSYADKAIIPANTFGNTNVVLYAQWENTVPRPVIVNNQIHLKLKAGYSVRIKGLPGGTTYTVTEQSKPGWSLVGMNGTTGDIKPNKPMYSGFINTYEPNTTTWGLQANKLVNGDIPSGDEKFNFNLDLVGFEGLFDEETLDKFFDELGSSNISENDKAVFKTMIENVSEDNPMSINRILQDLNGLSITNDKSAIVQYLSSQLFGVNGPAVLTFRLTEQVPETPNPIMNYDTSRIYAQVTITDDGEGNLSNTVQYKKVTGTGEIISEYTYLPQSFNNTYKNGSVELTKQVLNGACVDRTTVTDKAEGTKTGTVDSCKYDNNTQYAGRKFDYQVTLKDADNKPITGEYSGYTFNEQGQAIIQVSQNEPVTLHDLPYGAKYQVTEVNIPTGYTSTISIITGSVKAGETSTVSIINEYHATGYWAPEAMKKFGLPLQYGQFKFQLTTSAPHGVTIPQSQSVNNSNGSITFDEVVFTETGEYEFMISEIQGSNPAVVFDSSTHTIKVKVTDNYDGTLTVTPIMMDGAPINNPKPWEEQTPDSSSLTPVFVNSLKTGSIDVTKTANVWTDEGFKFTIHMDWDTEALNNTCGENTTGSNTECLANSELSLDGYTLPTLTGKYDNGAPWFVQDGDTFTLTKNNPVLHLTGIPHGLRVTITEDTPDEYTLTSETGLSMTAQHDTTQTIIIHNELDSSTKYAPMVMKQFKGGSLKNNTFKFNMRNDENTIMTTGTTNEDGTVTFDDTHYGLSDMGEHRYTIEEVNDEQDNVTYDTTVHKLTLNVTRASNGIGLIATPSWDTDPSNTGSTGNDVQGDSHYVPVFTNYYSLTRMPSTGTPFDTRLVLLGMLLVMMIIVTLALILNDKRPVRRSNLVNRKPRRGHHAAK